MVANKDVLIAKRNELEQQRLKAVAQVNAILGAIQFCDALLAEIEDEAKGEATKEVKSNDGSK